MQGSCSNIGGQETRAAAAGAAGRESGTALRLQERKRRLRCAPANQGGISEAARRTAGTAARQPHWPGGPLLSHKSAD